MTIASVLSLRVTDSFRMFSSCIVSIGIDTFNKLDGVLAAKRVAGSFKIVSPRLGFGTYCLHFGQMVSAGQFNLRNIQY